MIPGENSINQIIHHELLEVMGRVGGRTNMAESCMRSHTFVKGQLMRVSSSITWA